ncbi:RNA 3'-terminal phosphate cyclase [Eumeta japonica]|uniref:RNA 3'-terminal phosphate cyclase n=1 Tax=Eumeta variegata TaxID=151549 RepID=A0A4C1WI04_EUMVA|nr:RNA 3'-terminal phosphate cyclase [Eumeta japonica]
MCGGLVTPCMPVPVVCELWMTGLAGLSQPWIWGGKPSYPPRAAVSEGAKSFSLVHFLSDDHFKVSRQYSPKLEAPPRSQFYTLSSTGREPLFEFLKGRYAWVSQLHARTSTPAQSQGRRIYRRVYSFKRRFERSAQMRGSSKTIPSTVAAETDRIESSPILTVGSLSSLPFAIALPCALLADSTIILDLRGGTNADMAPQIDYMTEVYRPLLEKFGATFDFDLHKRGYFPKGGGHATITINPVSQLRHIVLTDPGNIKCIYGWSFVAGNLSIRLADKMSGGATQELVSKLSQSMAKAIKIECYKELREMAPDNCNVCETSTGCILGGDALGKRDVEPLAVGRSAAAQLLAALDCGACLDHYAQDQVIILMALANGRSAVRVGEVTLHTKTAIHIAETVAKVKFTITPQGNNNIIECNGLGFVNASVPR